MPFSVYLYSHVYILAEAGSLPTPYALFNPHSHPSADDCCLIKLWPEDLLQSVLIGCKSLAVFAFI